MDEMNVEQAKKIILYAVEKTNPRWSEYDDSWEWKNIDNVFIRKGYEQGGFAAFEFNELLKKKGISSIDKVGTILMKYNGGKKYSREYAGSLNTKFYRELRNRKFGEEGYDFYECVKDFLEKKVGNPGGWFWIKLWQMLICCNYLKKNYRASFSYYLKKKYAEFINMPKITDDKFLSITLENWEQFKKDKKPWGELYGIGQNVFNFIIGDLKDANFVEVVKDSYKLDAANQHFFKVTGIDKLIDEFNGDGIIVFLKQLNLPYTIRQINTAIYDYCSKTEAEKFGFCRDIKKCMECTVSYICEKNIIV